MDHQHEADGDSIRARLEQRRRMNESQAAAKQAEAVASRMKEAELREQIDKMIAEALQLLHDRPTETGWTAHSGARSRGSMHDTTVGLFDVIFGNLFKDREYVSPKAETVQGWLGVDESGGRFMLTTSGELHNIHRVAAGRFDTQPPTRLCVHSLVGFPFCDGRAEGREHAPHLHLFWSTDVESDKTYCNGRPSDVIFAIVSQNVPAEA